MSDKDRTSHDDELSRQFQNLLRDANVKFMFGGPEVAGQSAGGGMADAASPEADEALRQIRRFNLKPREIRDYLDRFVISQDEAKRVLSVAICDHYNHVRRCIEDAQLREREYAKQNVLLLGPTGVGKTYLVKCLARLIGVPFVKADATKFSETGYVGYDVEDIVRDLVRLADGNTELAQYGIIYVDEIDKIAGRNTHGTKDVSGRGVQVNLLKLMEETDVALLSQTDILGQIQAVMSMQTGGTPPERAINTRHMLFIVSGAFESLPGLIKRRLGRQQIGFASAQRHEEVKSGEYLKRVQSADLMEFGFEPEFVGRLPIRIAFNQLTATELEEILVHAEGNVLQQYRDDFAGYGIHFDMHAAAIAEIARRAETEQTGARGLMTVLERTFRNFKFELPSTGVSEFGVDPETVRNPEGSLKRLLEENREAHADTLRREVQEFSERFQDEHGLQIRFTPAAVKALVKRSLDTGKTLRGICDELFHDFPYGLKLIARNADKTAFTIPKAAVENPEQTLSKWITESYGRDEQR